MIQQRPYLRALWVTRWCCILCGWSFCIGSLAVSGLAQEIVLKAWTSGPDDPSVYRATNLHTAAERLEAIVTTRLHRQLRNQVRIAD